MDPVYGAELLRSRLSAYPVAPPLVADRRPAPESMRRTFDGRTSLRDLLPALDPAEVAELFETLIWLDRPLDVASAGPERVLVLAAAPEDVFLSMGGYLLKRRGRLDCLHVACFGASLERDDETALNARLAGVRTVSLGLPEAVARAPEPWAAEADARMLRSLTVLVHALIERERPALVFAPAAIGIDRDRRLVCDAARRIFEAGYFPGVVFVLYEALPSSGAHIEVDAFLSPLENAYVWPAEWFDDVTAVADRKRQLVAVMRAADVARHAPLLRNVARRNALLARRPNGEVERFWSLRLTFEVV